MSLRRTATAAGLSAWVALCGCATEAPTCDDYANGASLEIGATGPDGEFVTVAEGAEIETECGGNGFWLLAPSIRAHGVMPGEPGRFGDPGDPLVLIEAYLGDELVGASSYDGQHVGLTEVEDGAELRPLYVILDGRRCNELPVDLIGQTVMLAAQVEDACGNRATDMLELVVVNDVDY